MYSHVRSEDNKGKSPPFKMLGIGTGTLVGDAHAAEFPHDMWRI